MDKRQTAAQSQKLMVFVLTMSLYGLATLFTELIAKFQVGIVEFSVEYFLFIPLVLGMLFDPISAALGAATGELVFSEIMLGQFGGLGELEKFVTVTIGVYIAGRLVRNPKNRKMVAAAAMAGTAIQLFLGMVVDILKVQFAVQDFEAVPGLPESVFATEGFAFLNDVLFSGILFCMLPTLFLVPRLYGKIRAASGHAAENGEDSARFCQLEDYSLLRSGLRGSGSSGDDGREWNFFDRLGSGMGRKRHSSGDRNGCCSGACGDCAACDETQGRYERTGRGCVKKDECDRDKKPDIFLSRS